MQISLANKVAIITGAASGIGLATARRFLDSGATGIIAVDRRPEPPESLPISDRLIYLPGDVSVDSTAQRFTQSALDHFGQIDILINNAGVSIIKPIHLHTPEEWDAVFNTNVRSIYLASRHIIPHMISRKTGLILNTGSISGAVGIPTQGAYGPSKGAIHQLTRQMAIEYAPHGIRVNAICLGTVDTPIVHASAKASGDEQGYWKMLRDNHPLGRIASAEEVAAFFTYMASDLASFFTGATIMMDGGYTAK